MNLGDKLRQNSAPKERMALEEVQKLITKGIEEKAFGSPFFITYDSSCKFRDMVFDHPVRTELSDWATKEGLILTFNTTKFDIKVTY